MYLYHQSTTKPVRDLTSWGGPSSPRLWQLSGFSWISEPEDSGPERTTSRTSQPAHCSHWHWICPRNTCTWAHVNKRQFYIQTRLQLIYKNWLQSEYLRYVKTCPVPFLQQFLSFISENNESPAALKELKLRLTTGLWVINRNNGIILFFDWRLYGKSYGICSSTTKSSSLMSVFPGVKWL